MNQAEIELKIKSNLPPEDSKFVGEAVRLLGVDGTDAYYGKHVQQASEIVQALKRCAGQQQPKSRDIPGRPVTAQDRIVAGQLVGALEPILNDFRQKIWGSPQAQFKGRRAAEEWILKTGAEDEKTATPVEICNCGQFIHRSHGSQYGSALGFLWYESANGGRRRVKKTHAFPGSKLFKMAEFVSWLSLDTGFTEASLTTFTLTGIPPQPIALYGTIHQRSGHVSWDMKHFPPQLRWRLPGRRWVTLTVNVSDVTERELCDLYRVVRKKLNLARKKAFSERDELLLKAVEKNGGVPARGSRQRFWKELAGKTGLTPHSMRVQYHRLQRRIASAAMSLGEGDSESASFDEWFKGMGATQSAGRPKKDSSIR